MTVLFWFSAFMLFYVFVGYPLLLALWAKVRNKASDSRSAASSTAGVYQPDISILIVAYNEQAAIRHKILDLLATTYPREKLQIVVVSDASSDGTERIVHQFREQGVLLERGTRQRGKPANLNTFIPQLSGEIVVLMDARQSVAPDCLSRLANNFRNPAVGAVSGELHLAPVESANGSGSGMASGVGFYWRYEKFIRRTESDIDSSVGATGALYALRKDLFLTIPADTLLDDLLIPMNIVRQGYRVVFEPLATATDNAAVSARSEFARKVRTIAGNFQLLSRETWMLSPVRNRIWLQTISHKLLRLTAPVFILALVVSNALLLEHTFYQWLMVFQIIFYAAALGGLLSGSRSQRVKALAIPYAFCVLNWATVIGFFRFLLRQQQISWKQ